MPEQKQSPTLPELPQVKVPYAPHRNDPGKRRFREPPPMSVQESYRHNTIRLNLPGQVPIDVIPASEVLASSVDPSTVFGAESPVWIVSGCNTYGRLSTVDDQASSTEVLYEQLDAMDWTWHPLVLMASGRDWVETGAVVLGASQDEIVSKALRHGQEAVLLWDERGISVVATGLSDDVVDGLPVAVATSLALLGCPMRFGADGTCARQGGPFGSRSIAVATLWEQHRALLVSALGCTVCEGGVVCGDGQPMAISSSYVPSRRGGWQWGPPLSDAAIDAAWGEEGDDEDDE
jgi:hypothetical protein